MNLTYKEILKLKGTYLMQVPYFDRTGYLQKVYTADRIVMVQSATTIKVRLSDGSIMITWLFCDNLQKRYELATDKQVIKFMEEKYADFLYENYETILGMTHTPKYRGWGGNAFSEAEDDLLKEKGHYIDFAFVDNDKIRKIEEEYKAGIR